MNYKFDNDTLVIYFEGHIDSANAPAIEAEILKHPAYEKAAKLIIDADKLDYISSAGLRLVLKLRKHTQDTRVINASSAVYEIFDMTGFVEILPVEKAYRKLCVDGCDVLGKGSNGTVYRYDADTVVKVYHNPNAIDDIRRERELARNAFVLGIPTAIPYDVVKVGESYGSVFELLNAVSFSKLIKNEPEKIDGYIEDFVALLKKIHSTEVSPDHFSSMKSTALNWAEFLRDYLPREQADKIIKLINDIPDPHTMIHGDYHTNNVELQNGEILLIDMDTLSYGHPIFEFGTMFLGFVGFGELDHSSTEHFLGLPYETANYIWDRALRLYLGTEDADKVKALEDKAKIIGYVRLMRRTIRRYPKEDEMGQRIIANCRTQLEDLLGRIDSLEF